jgi:hypothetical protein
MKKTLDIGEHSPRFRCQSAKEFELRHLIKQEVRLSARVREVALAAERGGTLIDERHCGQRGSRERTNPRIELLHDGNRAHP